MSQEKVALVTGVSSGIGRAIAGVLARHGFRVFGTARGNGGAKRALENVELVHVDVRNEESVDSCVRTILDRAGRIDALVNNAGYTLIGSLEETTIEEAKQLFDTMSFAKTPQGLEYGPRNNVTEHSACYSFQTHFEFWRTTPLVYLWGTATDTG